MKPGKKRRQLSADEFFENVLNDQARDLQRSVSSPSSSVFVPPPPAPRSPVKYPSPPAKTKTVHKIRVQLAQFLTPDQYGDWTVLKEVNPAELVVFKTSRAVALRWDDAEFRVDARDVKEVLMPSMSWRRQNPSIGLGLQITFSKEMPATMLGIQRKSISSWFLRTLPTSGVPEEWFAGLAETPQLLQHFHASHVGLAQHGKFTSFAQPSVLSLPPRVSNATRIVPGPLFRPAEKAVPARATGVFHAAALREPSTNKPPIITPSVLPVPSPSEKTARTSSPSPARTTTVSPLERSELSERRPKKPSLASSLSDLTSPPRTSSISLLELTTPQGLSSNRSALRRGGSSRREPADRVLFAYPPGALDAVTIRAGDLARCTPGEYLNDSLVDLFVKLELLRVSDWMDPVKPPVLPELHVFSSFLFSRIAGALCRGGAEGWQIPKGLTEDTPAGRRARRRALDRVRTWSRGVDVFSKTLLLFPIHRAMHWSLGAVVLRRRADPDAVPTGYFFHLDSLGLHDSKRVAQICRLYLEHEWRARRVCLEAGEPWPRPMRDVSRLREALENQRAQREAEEAEEDRDSDVEILEDGVPEDAGASDEEDDEALVRFDEDRIRFASIRVPHQEDFSSCGVFVVRYVQELVRAWPAAVGRIPERADGAEYRGELTRIVAGLRFTTRDADRMRAAMRDKLTALHAASLETS